jgi:hypothetical protein
LDDVRHIEQRSSVDEWTLLKRIRYMHPIRKLVLLALLLISFSGAQALEKLEKTLMTLLPAGGQLPDWRQTFKPRFFQREDLFEYIDGAADQYLQYGFRMVLTADYAVSADSSSITIEIYCMSSPLLAFGIFAAERSAEEPKVDIGTAGYMGANVLNFCKGPYYIKITSFDLKKDMKPWMQEMGRSIAGRIAGDYALPELFSLFPAEDRVATADRYIPLDFLGQSYLKNGYRCDYHDEKCGTYQLYLMPFKDAPAAEDAFAQYKDFLLKQKPPNRFDRAEDYQRLLIYGSEQHSFLFCYDTYVGGGVSTKCPDALKMKMEQLVATLRQKR